jgi:polysaccharide deacetylase family protein (PEP-CTERM system associated)
MTSVQTVDLALTVDLEEWHHGLLVPPGREQILQDTHWLLECFARFGVRATFFVLGEIAERYPRLVRQIAHEGHEIGFHGAAHDFLMDAGPTRFQRELQEWLPRLADISAERVFGFRAPFFSLTPRTSWALRLLADSGVAYDASIYPGLNDRYGWPGAPAIPVRLEGYDLILFPVPVLPKAGIGFSGGAYLRLMPWRVVRRGMAAQRDRGEPGMIYVHPWEISERLPWERRASFRANLTRHLGRRRARPRLEALLDENRHRVGRMRDVLAPMTRLTSWDPYG